jgi:hypothetical protein
MTLDISNINPNSVDPDPTEYDGMEFLSGWLRSFRLDSETWVEQVFTSACDDIYHLLFDCPHAKKEALFAAIKQRCTDHGVQYALLTYGLTNNYTGEDAEQLPIKETA